jgi:hypothetical protein
VMTTRAVVVLGLGVVRVVVRVVVVRMRCHLFVIRSEIGLRLGNVLEQLSQHGADVVIGCEIENLLALPFRPHDPRSPQQAQMVADKRRRQPKRLSDRPDRAARLDAREHDAQACGIAKESKQVGKGNDAFVGCDKNRRQNRLR